MTTIIETPLPFLPAEMEFGEVLGKKFIKPAITWMLGQRGSHILDSVPPTQVEQSSCWWGIALYIESFLNSQDLPSLFVQSERTVLAEQSVRLATILLENQDGNGSWDSVTWDTAVICRSLLLLIEASQANPIVKVPEKINEDVMRATARALKWLVMQAVHWESVRYPFGPEDIAMIVRMMCVLERVNPQAFPSDLSNQSKLDNTHILPKNSRDFILQLVQRLLRQQVTIERASNLINFVHWESPFSTAHTLQAFSEALELLPPDIGDLCARSTAGAVAYVEESQDEGRWGMPNSTSLMLQAYVTACRTLDRYDKQPDSQVKPRPEIVFKSLRWLADEKQRFSDGSILHAFTHTSFFVLALQYIVLSKIDLMAYSMLQLYDYVIWDSQVRPSQERSERLRLADKLSRLNNELLSYMRFYNTTIMVVRVVSVIISALALFSFFSALNLVTITFAPFLIQSAQPQALFTGLGVYISLVSGFWLYTRKWLKPIEVSPKDKQDHVSSKVPLVPLR